MDNRPTMLTVPQAAARLGISTSLAWRMSREGRLPTTRFPGTKSVRVDPDALDAIFGQKHDGTLPIVGVNTFLGSDGSPIRQVEEVMRSSDEEKAYALSSVRAFQARNAGASEAALDELRGVALHGGNLFDSLMRATKVCSLGQISGALYEVGGRYRRSM